MNCATMDNQRQREERDVMGSRSETQVGSLGLRLPTAESTCNSAYDCLPQRTTTDRNGFELGLGLRRRLGLRIGLKVRVSVRGYG